MHVHLEFTINGIVCFIAGTQTHKYTKQDTINKSRFRSRFNNQYYAMGKTHGDMQTRIYTYTPVTCNHENIINYLSPQIKTYKSDKVLTHMLLDCFVPNKVHESVHIIGSCRERQHKQLYWQQRQILVFIS